MAGQDDKHDKARDLAEQALDKAAEGKGKEAEGLIEKARDLDPQAVKEAAQDAARDAEQAKSYVDKDKREG